MKLIQLDMCCRPTVPMVIAGSEIVFTVINGDLYATLKQYSWLLGVTDRTLIGHVRNYDNGLRGENSGWDLSSTYSEMTVYQIPVMYMADPSTIGQHGGAHGGIRLTNFYALKDMLKIATRLQNRRHQRDILGQLIPVYKEYLRLAGNINQ